MLISNLLICMQSLIVLSKCLYIPLSYYSQKNLPFGFQTQITGSETYKNGTEYNFT